MLAPGGREQRTIADFETGRLWLLWAVSSQAAIYGVIAVDLGNSSIAEAAATKLEADNVLAEANAMLKRLDLEAALTAATSRAKTEESRAALNRNRLSRVAESTCCNSGIGERARPGSGGTAERTSSIASRSCSRGGQEAGSGYTGSARRDADRSA